MEAKPKSDTLAALLSEGTVFIGGLTITLERRAASRIVFGFFEVSSDSNLLDEICAAENLSQINVLGAAAGLTGAPLEDFLSEIAASAFVAGLDVTLFGIGGACGAVFRFSALFQNSVLVAFDPQDALPNAVPATGTVIYDPFVISEAQLNRNGGALDIQWLKCFASSGNSLDAIWRMKQAHAILPAVLRGELEPHFYFTAMRARKNLRTYRISMETALEARGKTGRVAGFRQAFRARLAANMDGAKFARQRVRAIENRPDRPGAWARLRQAGKTPPDRPSAGGNTWMLHQEKDHLHHMSDRWRGVTIGYVEQDGVTLAETPDVALGFLALGDGFQVERPLTDRFEWHVLDAKLDGTQPAFGPTAEATLACEQVFAKQERLFSILALSQIQPGITLGEAEPGGSAYDALLAQVETGQTALGGWNKSLSIDRIRLALLTGAPQTPSADAASHYASIARALTADLIARTSQETPPFVVVIPQAGTRNDGTSEVALAESRFDLDALGLNALVPTPAYPWPLMSGTPGTPSPEAAILMDELSALAVRARQQGQPWHCPALQLATLKDRTILAQFSSMAGLVTEDGPHGFLLTGQDDVPSIETVEIVSDTQVRLTLDGDAPLEGVQLAYAWGHKSAERDGEKSANHGALRDTWACASRAVPGQTLHRYALPGRVSIQSSQ